MDIHSTNTAPSSGTKSSPRSTGRSAVSNPFFSRICLCFLHPLSGIRRPIRSWWRRRSSFPPPTVPGVTPQRTISRWPRLRSQPLSYCHLSDPLNNSGIKHAAATVTPSRAYFFIRSRVSSDASRHAATAARSQTLPTPVTRLTNSDSVNAPGTAASSSPVYVKNGIPSFSARLHSPGSPLFKSMLAMPQTAEGVQPLSFHGLLRHRPDLLHGCPPFTPDPQDHTPGHQP